MQKTGARSGDLTDSFLVLGKFLTPRLYISYSAGLIEPINIFQIRHYINDRMFLQSENSTLDNSVSLYYFVERE